MFKRKFKSSHSNEPTFLGRLLFIFGIFALCALLLGGFWFLSQLGPRDVDQQELRQTMVVSEEAMALLETSKRLEQDFESIFAVRDPSPEDVAILKQSLDAMEAYIEALPMGDSVAMKRVRELRETYQDFASQDLLEESLAHEKVASKLADADDFDAARREYRKALDLQQEINEDFPLSTASNVGRATLLERYIRNLMAEPLLRRSMAFEAEAMSFIEEQNWVEAEKKLQQAIGQQDQLNREFRGTNQASVARLENLRIQLLGIRSGQSHVEIEEILAEADLRQAEGENLEAARLYQEATRLQRQLNEAFRGSPFASAERVLEFQRKADTAESYSLGLSIESNHRRLNTFLAERRVHEATGLIAKMRRDITQMQEAFPRSSLNDEALELKIRYLNLIQNELGFIQNRVYDALLPIPQEADWKMLRTEVPQALYSRIMGTNPSRNRGDVQPVDSVSWVDAKNFCERLSWVMGKPVRLPTESEFRQVLGPLRYLVLEDHVWSVSDAEGQAQAIGSKASFGSGAFDLLGNVSEWLESVDRFDTEDARHIGGHAQDSLEVIFTVPVRDASRSERNRMTGFRFVVRTD